MYRPVPAPEPQANASWRRAIGATNRATSSTPALYLGPQAATKQPRRLPSSPAEEDEEEEVEKGEEMREALERRRQGGGRGQYGDEVEED